ncbi:helix-hairpin-helix domain-containing protein [Kocuria sp. cx-455]|uniref:helix-hairpin-helix domain-containing protein n=1 Tax=Kocuria sp. cx-455 TaxID=2771377 RepID=UPI003D740288
MSGVNYRGRARLRDQQATERLSALLEGVAERAEEPAVPGGHVTAVDGPGEQDGPHHRHPVAVRAFFTRPAVIVVIVVLLAVCGISALSLLPGDADPESSVVAEADPSGAATVAGEASGAASAPVDAPGSGPGSHAAPATTDTGGPSAALTVHVVGEVKQPGVVQLSPGARVIDAVDAAGGLTGAAVTERINLAQPLTDGQQVLIPNEKTAAQAEAAGDSAGTAQGAPAVRGVPRETGSRAGGSETRGEPGTGAAASGGPINLNTAAVADLEELPRVGPVLAQRIVDFRAEHGPFTAPEQLDDVSGIGPAMLEALLPLVTV